MEEITKIIEGYNSEKLKIVEKLIVLELQYAGEEKMKNVILERITLIDKKLEDIKNQLLEKKI